MANEAKIFQMTAVDENGNEITDLNPRTVSEAVAYNDSEPVIQAVGGVTVGSSYPNSTVQKVLYDILHPYVKPAISLSGNPSAGVREVGDTIDTINLTAAITKKSEDITKVEFYKGSTVVATVDAPSASGGSETYALTGEFGATTGSFTVKARVTDAKGGITDSSTLTYNWILPYYYGAVNSADVTGDMVKALTKVIKSKTNVSHSFTLENAHMCFAVPSGWALKTIIDPNGFDITSSFTLKEVSVLSNDGVNHNYNVYVSDLTSQSAFVVKFNI